MKFEWSWQKFPFPIFSNFSDVPPTPSRLMWVFGYNFHVPLPQLFSHESRYPFSHLTNDPRHLLERLRWACPWRWPRCCDGMESSWQRNCRVWCNEPHCRSLSTAGPISHISISQRCLSSEIKALYIGMVSYICRAIGMPSRVAEHAKKRNSERYTQHSKKVTSEGSAWFKKLWKAPGIVLVVVRQERCERNYCFPFSRNVLTQQRTRGPPHNPCHVSA